MEGAGAVLDLEPTAGELKVAELGPKISGLGGVTDPGGEVNTAGAVC